MPGNIEAKKKCLEKLTQMETYLPFLDFMIDKIKKKSNEISLECQLSKFQNLRSMILEKSSKHSWDAIIRVEEVIQKLIAKLDYKEEYNPQPDSDGCLSSPKGSQELLKVSDSVESKNNIAASVSIIPSSTTTTISVTNASSLSHVTTVDSRPQDSPMNTVDLIIKTLKMSVDSCTKNNTDNEKDKENLSSSIGLKQLSKDTSKTDTPEKIVETDLDKDLDHFELTAGPNLPEADSKNTAKESSTEGPKEVSSHVDLLSSSREKLLKSLQKKLNSPVVDPASSQFSAENNIKKTSDSQSISAFSFSSTRTCANEDRIKSDSLDIASNSEMITNSVLDKHNSNVSAVEKSVPVSVPVLSPTIYSDNYAKEKSQSDLGNIPSDFNSKQKLREKLSADICELYRVPGRSVGGSLRSLKDVKDNKKSVVLEEEELFKPDKITEVRHHSNSLTCNDSKKIKSQKSLSVFKSDYKVNRNKDKSSVKKQHDSENLQDDKKRDEMEPKLSESGRDKSDLARDWLDKKMAGGSHSKEGKKLPDGSCRKEKGSEIDSFDDEELLEFVKENVQSLPHLSKLKPSDLRRVHSSLFSSTATPEADKDSLISEDSFQDLDDFMNQENLLSDNKLNLKASEGLENTKQSEDESRIPSLGLKATEIVDGSVSKAVKTFIKPAEKEKIGESTDNKTNDLVKSKIQSADESDFIHKLIEDIPSNTAVVKKKKGVLDLPIPKHDSLPLPKLDSNPISDSSELSKVVPVSNRDPRNKKLMPSKPSGDVNRPLIRLESEVHTSLTNNYFNPNLYLDPNYTSRFYSAAHPQILHRNNYAERISRFNHPLECLPRDPLMEPRFPNSVQISLFPTNQIMPHDMNQVPSYGFYNFNDIKYRQAGHFHNNSRSSRYRNDFFKNGDHHFSRPKSYVEYKRIKLIKEKKLDERKSQKKSEQKNGVSGNMCMSNSIRMPAEKEIVNSENSVTTQGKEILNSNQKSKRKKKSKSAKFKTNSNSMIQQETNQKLELTKIQKTAPTESKKEGEESKKKIVNERRQSLDCEDTVSPLVKLYQSGNAPKTGRGYGLQNFKIPKKVREDNTIIKPKASNTLVQDIKPTGKEEKQGSLTNRLNPLKEPGEKENDVLNEDEVSMNTTVKEDNLLINLQTADENELCCNKNICESQNNFNEFKIKSNITNLSSTLSTNIEKSIINTISSSVRDETEIEVLNTEKKSNGAKINENENCATKSENENDSEKVKERDLTICDSSSENTICQSETVESKSTCEKRPAVVKEEITQEFVEALIRKSFESGEGKLLLAQAKLFEEFTKKLNSKKLKTIQKIINSESDSSSSSTESSSEIEKKKKKNKKSERSKKKKKKVRRSRKLKSSSSERDESSEEETVEKKENPVIIDKQKNEEKVMESEFKKADIGPNENITIIPVDQNSKSCHLTLNLPSENKGNNKSPKVNLKECISRKKNQRKQGQKRLLEQILKEDHQPPELEMENNNSKSEDPDEKELEQKTKPKPKGKGKTELDRLHDDIRSMFISSGVVTATGQRMCRMLKASGGSMNNLDIVKESAKMVQEQKLKNVQSPRCTRRSRSKNVRNRRDRSSSQSSEVLSSRDRSKSETRSGIADTSKGSELILTGPILSTDNLKKRPCVVLHKLELNNFKYGRKTGMGSISFCSVRGRNVAMRGRSWRRVSSSSSMQISILEKDLAKNVFLARNKRKYESLIGKKIAKCYRGKSLTEIVKYLPLKMAKMKHLEIGENKSDKAFKEIKRNKNVSSKKNKKKRRCDSTPSTINDADILDYAFEKKKVIYPCKLCLHLTRNITSHYKTAHPDSEVLISRLSKEEAQKAIKDSRENNYSGTSLHQSSSLEMIRRRVKSKLNGSVAYYCRMCNSAKFTYKNAFFSHVSTHTGEYRFKCPSEGCSVTMATKENLKYHILSNHSESRYDLYRKIIELFPLPKESGSVYGYICSKCHYVQMFYGELERHVQKYHSSHENVSIIKIDMSAKVSPEPEKIVGIKKAKTWKKILDDSEGSNDEEENLENSNENINIELENEEETSIMALGEVRKLRKRKHPDTDSPLQTALNEVELKDATEENSESRASKKPLLEKKMESIKQCESIKHNVDEKESSDENARTGDKATDLENKSSESCVPESVTLDNCYDVKNVSQLTGSADINFFENSNKKNVSQSGSDLLKNSSGSAQKQGTRKLKVGPLEVQISGNSIVLYECYVKGCLFSTKVFDLFEKHVKISHAKTKWDGMCEICGVKAGRKLHVANKLTGALKHLRLHQSEGENILLNDPSEAEADFAEHLDRLFRERYEKTKLQNVESENNSPSYPRVPLLRVRNLVGDRLSTPKDFKDNAEESAGEVANSEEDSKTSTSDTEKHLKDEAPAMFTIENVRSLNSKDNPEESNLQVEDLVPEQDKESSEDGKAATAKPVIVRSCPTRKIAIRPDSNSHSIEVGHLKVVKTATVTPVVLSSLTNITPIRILSSLTPSSKRSKFSVQPVMVSASPPFLPPSKAVSVILPVSSTTSTTSSVTTVTTTAETIVSQQKIPNEEGATEKNACTSIETLLNGPTKSGKLPSKRVRTKVYRANHDGTSSSEVEEMDESKQKSINALQKLSSPSVGNKSVKDAKIYQEMLTKTKLCHLFKCMAIECSFTCNSESVFTQHIGLHEAQRRMKNQKSWKNNGVESNYKTRKVFNWHQCAYCCEVLANTSFALSRHIIVEHGHCIYQCAYCFYRAVSQSYVEIHQNLAHGQILKSNARIIYKCKPLSRAPPAASALEKQGRRQSVRPYHCDQCGSKFFITQEFMNHLTAEHQSVTAYTCHICKNLCFKADRLIVHYKLHSYCTYQCAYCLHGTETEKEMVFHLCNFHFSQPPYMYVRALAENQKSHGSQLDSLKVIVYESDTLNPECIVEADPEEEPTDDSSKNIESLDLSSIVAELGINAEYESTSDVSPLIKELASIGSENSRNLSLKTLLPNAQFSSENETSGENCSFLISSGQNSNREQNEEKDMSVPLGQLNLEVVSMNNRQNQPTQSSTSTNVTFPSKNMKLNEIIINFHHKEKQYTPAAAVLEESKDESVIATAFHKMPPVVLSRKSGPKNVHPPKNTCTLSKKIDNIRQEGEVSVEQINRMADSNTENGDSNSSANIENILVDAAKSVDAGNSDIISNKKGLGIAGQPLITNVISLSSKTFEKDDFNEGETSQSSFPKISEVCSLSCNAEAKKIESTESRKIVINIQSKPDDSVVLKPPIIRVEDFAFDEELEQRNRTSVKKIVTDKPEKTLYKSKTKDSKNTETLDKSVESPEVIILEEEKTDRVVTVTIDSEDEKEVDTPAKSYSDAKVECSPVPPSSDDNTIRKEMEKLRNQIASETDCLLFDDTVTKTPLPEISLTIKPPENPEKSGLLSPIEEAICSLHKKLEEEGQKQKKEKSNENVSEKVEEIRTLPRTRSFTKGKAKKGEVGENVEKSDSDDSNTMSNVSAIEGSKKDKKFKEELSGKELYICGNEKCNFSAEGDLQLKDHLYVCDLSRESSMLLCPHCSKPIKQFNTYLEHLKHHGEKKYSCGLCSFTSAVETSVTRHVKQKHKCGQLKSVPRDPPKEGYLVFYPKNYKLEKQDFELSGYSPGDEDKLPLQAVYQVNVKCAKCPYFTKVRSNMVRHLKIHVKSVETEGGVIVPSTAPTNPVPCLDTKERMFDKMTNLAASSQLAQAKEKTLIEALAPEEEAKLPQFIAEQMRYKCCLPDCNYITVDGGMLKHHIKALHDEISYYSCPHCKDTVHVDVRHVTLDKIGHHLKHHDSKLYKCAHCIYFHYQKPVVEKHTLEKHPDRRNYVYTIREPKGESSASEEQSPVETSSKMWKCGLCNDFQSFLRMSVLEHLGKVHSTKSKYKCQLCDMKSNLYHAFYSHFASKHAGEKVAYLRTVVQVNSNCSDYSPVNADSSSEHFDTTPLWQRGAPRVRHIRGILIEEEEVKTKKNKKPSEENETETEMTEIVAHGNAFYCPLCSDKKTFSTRNPDCFRSHLYQELNYQQFACILCGKMFVDKKDYERHHSRCHPDKPQALKQTKEDGEITFWVDKVIAKQRLEMENKKRRLSEDDSNDSQSLSKKKKKCD